MSYGFGNSYTQNTIGGNMDNERIDPNNVITEEFKTDVNGLLAEGYYRRGIDKFPVFEVSEQEFNNNLEKPKTRLRFDKNSKVALYIEKTRFNRPFYIKFINENGKEFYRKIK